MSSVTAGEFTRIYDPSEREAERWYVNDHTFVRDDSGTWHLIGITDTEPPDPHTEIHLAHATAPALHGPWTKHPFALTADPEWGETHLWAPHVVAHDGLYWLFVCGGAASPTPESRRCSPTEYRIHLATSPDGREWTRHPENPLVVDGFEARDPMVLRVADRWIMYYTATTTPEGGHHVVAAAESDDLIHWTGRHVVYEDEMVGTIAGPTESPFVVERHGIFYLFIGPDWQGLVDSFKQTGRYDPAAYRRTRVLASDDPLNFRIEDQVGLLDAHAAEVIVDEAGETWVSHCGWGQRGVHLAPLTWSD